MNTSEKWGTWIVGGLAVLPGFWGAYTGYQTMKLKQPFDLHAEMVKSFQGEISSAKSAGIKRQRSELNRTTNATKSSGGRSNACARSLSQLLT